MLYSIVAFLVTHQWLSLFLIISLWYIYNFYKNNIWRKLGVYYLTPLPIFGNDLEVIIGRKAVHELLIENYNKIGRRRFGGVFTVSSPLLIIKDPALVESILVKDFHHFTDRWFPMDEEWDPLSIHLFTMKGQRWKNLRNKLSPIFTSGKLKTMHQQIIDCANVLVDVFQKDIESGGKVDFKETMADFTTDVIGSCAYGLSMNSLKDPNNEFRKMGRKVFEASLLINLRDMVFMILASIWPKLPYILGLKSLPSDVNDFFMNLVPNTIKAREMNPQYTRNDFIQLLMNLRQENDLPTKQDGSKTQKGSTDTEMVHLDDNLIAANSFLFFIAGFETTASTLTYCLFELAQHPDIQEKLYQEVKDVLSKYNGQPTYDAIKNLHYMDLVISETIRKYPPLPVLLRICTESYLIPGTDIVLPKGQRVKIPTYALHHDPDIYAEPENFVPERFSLENKDSIPKGAYIPFGQGPRRCIGGRFALMEIKVCLSKVLSKFRIVKNADTSDVIEFNPNSEFVLTPNGEIYMNIVEREV